MKKLSLLIFFVLVQSLSYAQLNNLGSMYFQNRYLANPAMAGTTAGFELNGGYKAQWVKIEDAPTLAAVTATYGFPSKKVGLGLSFYSDKAGIIQQVQTKITYAYHISLNASESYLDFGLSAGLMDQWIDFDRVNADFEDQVLYDFNQQSRCFDGDLGMTLRKNQLTIEGVISNLRRIFNRDDLRRVIDRNTFLASVSYKFLSNGQSVSGIEPRLVYRGLENFGDIVDLALNLSFASDKLMLSSVYHSTGNFTVGIGATYANSLSILAQYTTSTSALRSYTNGEFEVGLKYRFLNR